MIFEITSFTLSKIVRGGWSVTTHRIKHRLKCFVRNPVSKRNINRIAFTLAASPVFLRSSPREVLAELVEAARHDAIRRVERFLNTVSMMAVDVDVKYTWECAKELNDSEHNVVDVAEAGSLSFLSVMQTACPVYGNIGGARSESLRSS